MDAQCWMWPDVPLGRAADSWTWPAIAQNPGALAPRQAPGTSLASAWSKGSRCAGHLAAARLLPQVRTRVLNDQPLATFAAGIPASTRRQIQRRSRRSLPALSRSPTTAVAYLPWHKPEMYHGCGSASLTY